MSRSDKDKRSSLVAAAFVGAGACCIGDIVNRSMAVSESTSVRRLSWLPLTIGYGVMFQQAWNVLKVVSDENSA